MVDLFTFFLFYYYTTRLSCHPLMSNNLLLVYVWPSSNFMITGAFHIIIIRLLIYIVGS